MLRVGNVTKSYGGQIVLAGVSFHLRPRERAGLVGPNGCGKSTLLRIVAGHVPADAGHVRLTPGRRLGYLAQDSQVTPGRTLWEEMESVLETLNQLREEYSRITARLEALPRDDPEAPKLVGLQASLFEEIERLGEFTVEGEIARVLKGLGFAESDHGRRTEEFSGGWQMRIALAKTLLEGPDLLLLDEPTNHLDLEAVEWLEDYLKSYRGGVLIVSHDRYVLDRVTARTLALEKGRLAEWPGNFSAYVAERERRRAEQASAYRRQQVYLEQQRAFIERFRAKATKATQVQSRERLLERMEKVERPESEARRIALRFPECRPSGREVVQLRKVAKSYGDREVLRDVNLLLERGDRLALVGANGAGKSTLLRLMAGVDRPTRGSVIEGQHLVPGYFAQQQAEALDPESTALEELQRTAAGTWTTGELRGLLGRFLFSGDDVFKPIAVLSGGERSRVALAKLLLQPANVLFLDEPTNHLDISAREVLEEALVAFPGALVLISHDRFLLDRLAAKVAEIEGGRVRVHLGNYSRFRARKAQEAPAAALHAAPARRSAPEPRRGRQAAQPTANGSAQPRPFSQRRFERLEEQIERLEAEKARLEADLADDAVYRDPDRLAALLAGLEEANATLATLDAEWSQMAMAAP